MVSSCDFFSIRAAHPQTDYFTQFYCAFMPYLGTNKCLNPIKTGGGDLPLNVFWSSLKKSSYDPVSICANRVFYLPIFKRIEGVGWNPNPPPLSSRYRKERASERVSVGKLQIFLVNFIGAVTNSVAPQHCSRHCPHTAS